MILSWAIVAMGQPAWIWWFSLLAASIGYALFWILLLEISRPSKRFWLGTAWMAAVQALQLSWFLGHPYWYILTVYAFLMISMGMQFGALCLLVNRQTLSTWNGVFAIAGLWTLIEWSRLFVLSGFTFNSAGLALTATIPSLQLASLVGVFGLTFWVVFTNAAALRAWILPKTVLRSVVWGCLALFPYLLGFGLLSFHLSQKDQHLEEPMKALLVQPAFPIEEAMPFKSRQELIAYVLDEWTQLHSLVQPHQGKRLDVIALPEFVVPFFTYSAIFPYSFAEKIITDVWGPQAIQKLPPLKSPWAMQLMTQEGKTWWVNHAFFSQALANLMNAPLIVGLEDYDEEEGRHIPYSAALFFLPFKDDLIAESEPAGRYEKRVLVPMGEYIPFSFCADLAASYGICGSFTCGCSPKIFKCNGIPVGVSICYEETFGDLTRENRVVGAEVLVNLTNDCWYPQSRLPQQHFDHARLRTVESGIPLLRSCNTGITGALDSLGRTVAILGDDHPDPESLASALYVEVPRYHYQTLYAKTGDLPVVMLSALFLLPWMFGSWRKRIKL